jgi:hypothetical protein
VKIIFDSDIPVEIQPQIEQVIRDSVEGKCECGCDEIYISLTREDRIDVKCYDCGTSFFELEIEIEDQEETTGA